MTTELIMVDTPQGPGRLHVDLAAGPEPYARTIVLGHGAGGGVTAPDLVALASALPMAGVSVVRYEQPWRVAGRKVAVMPPKLDEGWIPAVEAIRHLGGSSLTFGGRSAGARVACRTADALGAIAVLCLAFPLHPPGRPERSRLSELLNPTVPVLVVQGERDPFGGAEVVADQTSAAVNVTVVAVPGGDHGLKVPARNPVRPAAVHAMIIELATTLCLA